jgi:hypothetical protein
MESLPMEGKPGGKVLSSLHLSPSPPPSLVFPNEFKQFADVFSPPMNCALPPHRTMDISINLNGGATPPFRSLQQQLKFYIDDNLKKGFICISSSSAAAPIFFVRTPGKKPRPCVDYCGLNFMTIQDSYPIPILGQLLNQLQGCCFFAKISGW